MTILAENDLEFDFSSATEAIIIDGVAFHKPCTIKMVVRIAANSDAFVFL